MPPTPTYGTEMKMRKLFLNEKMNGFSKLYFSVFYLSNAGSVSILWILEKISVCAISMEPASILYNYPAFSNSAERICFLICSGVWKEVFYEYIGKSVI